jgi:hypothetical protein
MMTEASVTKSLMETYTIRNRGEYATIALRCSESKGEDRYFTGEILINSSFGSWANYWGACGCPFKEFLQKISFDYAFTKFMGNDLEVFDEDRTIEEIKRKLIEVRREKRVGKEEVRDLWEEIESIDTYSEEAFGNSCRDIASNFGPRHPLRDYFNEPWDLKRTKPDVQATGFWRDIWPHFIAELKKETAAGVPEVDLIRVAAEELLNRLYAEYPEKLPLYCRDAASRLDEVLHPEVFNPDGVSVPDSEVKR